MQWIPLGPGLSGLIWIQTFDTLMIFLKEGIEKIFRKNQQMMKKHAKLTNMQSVRLAKTKNDSDLATWK